jgi:ABC-type transport system involved in multi-copper enzyme maturation permease subunit
VLAWEIRRLVVSRATWITTGATFAAFCLLMLLFWGRNDLYTLRLQHGTLSFYRPSTSVWGLTTTYVQSPGMFFALLLPFVCTDGIARDLRRRTHELLMTSPVPTWAYVWGRYLAVLLFSLVLAGTILVAIVVVTAILHLLNANEYPPVALANIIAVWALVVLPPVLLLSGLSFALGTLLPSWSTQVKLTILLTWFACGASLWYVLNPKYANPNAPAPTSVVWDPTSIAPTFPLQKHFKQVLEAAAQTMSKEAFLHYARTIQQSMPDLHTWIVPHLLWSGVGVMAVLATVRLFRRFSNAHG